MEVSEATALINGLHVNQKHPQVWVDLGCGTGIFSKALASKLPAGSSILCCDREQKIEPSFFISDVQLKFVQLDFEKEILDNLRLDGILMANSLHYIRDQKLTLLKWRSLLNPDGLFVVIEYDTEEANPWIPFPVSFIRLKQLFHDAGIESVAKLGSRKSIFGNTSMYACEALTSA